MNEIRHITEVRRAPHRVTDPMLTIDTPLTYKQLAEDHGMTVRALGLIQ